MPHTRIESDVHVAGSLTCQTFGPPAASIDNAAIRPDAKIAASKLQHQHHCFYAQPNTTATAETRAIYLVRGVTTNIVSVRAGSIGVCTGNATMTVDVRKNGATILASPITLNSSNSPRVSVAGTIATAAGAANDLYEVVITVNAGTGTLGTGLFVMVRAEEDAQ